MTADVYRHGVYEGRVTADSTTLVVTGPDGMPDPDEMPMQILSSFLNSNRPRDWREQGLSYPQAVAETIHAAALGQLRVGRLHEGPRGPEIHHGAVTIRPVNPQEPPCPGTDLSHSHWVTRTD